MNLTQGLILLEADKLDRLSMVTSSVEGSLVQLFTQVVGYYSIILKQDRRVLD